MSMQPEPPDNLSQGSNRRLTLIGVSLWVLVGGMLATLVFTDIGGEGVESGFQIAVGVSGVILIAVVGGAIVYQILKRFNLIGSVLINVFWGILFMIALPVVAGSLSRSWASLPAPYGVRSSMHSQSTERHSKSSRKPENYLLAENELDHA